MGEALEDGEAGVKAMKLNAILAGVGGQGLITMANLIAKAALRAGKEAIVAETHGLNQRGGSVVVHVRLGDALAPLVPEGRGDLMLAMEIIEAVRYSKYLKGGAVVYLNDYLLPPSLPGARVPKKEELLSYLKENFEVRLFPATKVALELGDPRVANVALLAFAASSGAFEGFFGLKELEEVIKEEWGGGKNLEALELASRVRPG